MITIYYATICEDLGRDVLIFFSFQSLRKLRCVQTAQKGSLWLFFTIGACGRLSKLWPVWSQYNTAPNMQDLAKGPQLRPDQGGC